MAREQSLWIDARCCSDTELVARIRDLTDANRSLCAKLLVHLAEMDARMLYREQGFSSMFEYAVAALRMSEAEAYLRIHAARLGRRFPVIIERIGAGELNLTAAKLLAPLWTADNHMQLLERVAGKRKRDVERIVAELAPKPDVPQRAIAARGPSSGASTTLPMPMPRPSSAAQPSASTAGASTPSTLQQPAAPSAVATPTFALQSPQPRAKLTPLRPERYKLELTIGQEAYDKLEELRDLLRHANPKGDLASILERAVSELHERTLRKRFAKLAPTRQAKSAIRLRARRATGDNQAMQDAASMTTALRPVDGQHASAHDATAAAASPALRPVDGQEASVQDAAAASSRAPRHADGRERAVRSRYVSRAVVRQVYERDQGQCTFVAATGQRCSARGFLELHHHDTTYARGGAATVDNLRLTCRAHNALFAERDYGRDYMQARLRTVAHARGDLVQNDSNFDPGVGAGMR